jgi:hypothetical protein
MIDYAVIAESLDSDNVMISGALDIVKKFIVERKLILFGGLAIDYALRLKGDKLYSDTKRPDLDFLSPRNVDDAYDLADILTEAGFEAVGAIRGLHVQTMRVRVNFLEVADIGYAPAEIFDKLPTLNYQGMRIIHPDYQRIDMHMAFCFPFSGAPREDIFNRWEKDLKRFNMFENYYPIVAAGADAGANNNFRIHAKLNRNITSKDYKTLTVSIHGFAAYAILSSTLSDIAKKMKVEKHLPPCHSYKVDSNKIEFDSPIIGEKFIVASPCPEVLIDNTYTKYHPFMDILPESWRNNETIILSTKNRLLASSIVKLSDGLMGFVVSPQYLLLWLLFQFFQTGNQVYKDYYAYTLELLKISEELLSDINVFLASPFAPTVSYIGNVNYDHGYIIKMANISQAIKQSPPSALHLNPNISEILKGLPVNYYPRMNTKIDHPIFNYNENIMFLRNGKSY